MRKKKAIRNSSGTKRASGLASFRANTNKFYDLPVGFTLKPFGRDGVVYYKENGNVLELQYEMDGTKPGILLYTDGLKEWTYPEIKPVTLIDRQQIQAKLEEWARKHKGAVTFATHRDLIRPWEDGSH